MTRVCHFFKIGGYFGEVEFNRLSLVGVEYDMLQGSPLLVLGLWKISHYQKEVIFVISRQGAIL